MSFIAKDTHLLKHSNCIFRVVGFVHQLQLKKENCSFQGKVHNNSSVKILRKPKNAPKSLDIILQSLSNKKENVIIFKLILCLHLEFWVHL